MAGSQSLLRGVLEIDGLARHANPVFIGVHRGAWLVDGAAVDGAKQGGVNRTRCNAGDFCGQLAQERLHGGGMACALNVQSTRKLAVSFELFDEIQYLLAWSAHRRHAWSGIDCGLNVIIERLDIGRGHLHDGHRALIFRRQRGFALTHQTRAVAGDEQGIGGIEAAGGISRSDFTHRHAHNACGAHAKVCQQVCQGNLNSGDSYLGGFGVVGLRVVIDKL